MPLVAPTASHAQLAVLASQNLKHVNTKESYQPRRKVLELRIRSAHRVQGNHDCESPVVDQGNSLVVYSKDCFFGSSF